MRGGAVALSPKRIAAICRSTSLLQERARDFLRGTHSLKPNFVSVTVFPCASSKLCFCGYPHPQSTEWDGGRENLLDVILWFTLLRHAAPETKRVRRSAHQQESLRASELLYLLSPNHILNSEAHSAPLGELTWPTLVTKNDIVACCACAGADKLIPVDATAAET